MLKNITFNVESGDIIVTSTSALGGVVTNTYTIGDVGARAALGSYGNILDTLWAARQPRKRANVKALQEDVFNLEQSGGLLSDRKLERIRAILSESEAARTV